MQGTFVPMVCDIPVPILRIDRVYHVGLFDGQHSQASYEGNTCSVSNCPEDWIRISKLGGRPVWQMDCPGAKFLDIKALEEHERGLLLEWALDSGLVTRTTTYRGYQYDTEENVVRYTTHLTYEEADRETDSDEVADDLVPLPTRHDSYRTTDALRWLCGEPRIGDIAGDFAIMAWARENGLDGVWWSDTHGHWSAPRGAIFSERVQAWTRRECSLDEVEELDLPRPFYEHPPFGVVEARLAALDRAESLGL